MTISVRIGEFVADLTPGVVDEQAVELYTNGACWYLAWMLHQLSGFPVVTIGGYLADDGGYETDDYAWNHVGVQTPDGRFLDLTGAHDPHDAMEQWLDGDDELAFEPGIYPVDIEDFAEVTTYDPHTVDATAAEMTRVMAQAVLDTHGYGSVAA